MSNSPAYKRIIRQFYRPILKKNYNFNVWLLNFLILGFYILSAIFIPLMIYDNTYALLKFFLNRVSEAERDFIAVIDFGYFIAHCGVLFLLISLIKFCIFGSFKSKTQTTISMERYYWILLTAISSFLLSIILFLLSSWILGSKGNMKFSADSINSNQTVFLCSILIFCYIYVLGHVQKFRDALKESKTW